MAMSEQIALAAMFYFNQQTRGGMVSTMIKSKCPESYNEFWTVTFSTYGSVYLGFFRTATSKIILKKKATVHFS